MHNILIWGGGQYGGGGGGYGGGGQYGWLCLIKNKKKFKI
jgi:hypothetical protein